MSKKKYETAKEFEIPKDYQISVLLASMASKAMLVLMPEVFLEDVLKWVHLVPHARKHHAHPKLP